MIYLIIAGIVFALLVWGVLPNASFKTAGVRIVSGSISLALFAAAGFFALRGGWGKALVLLTVGAGLALSAKAPLKAQAKPQDHGDRLSLKAARDILGVDAKATTAEIRAAYHRLMQLAHPDKGGTQGLAAQLNAARDRLLKP